MGVFPLAPLLLAPLVPARHGSMRVGSRLTVPVNATDPRLSYLLLVSKCPPNSGAPWNHALMAVFTWAIAQNSTVTREKGG